MASRCRALGLAWLFLLGPAAADGQGLVDTLHNLSATGRGRIRAPSVGQLCVFCHTPHNASQTRALWNRDLPPTTYTLYESSTLEATLQQPTGASRLCLSCHDGTTALGALRVPPAGGRVSLGPLAGRASLGTDLSDDHPVSFVYDAGLAERQGQLADPAALSPRLPLDDTQQLQCTACHDPHEDRFRQFLRLSDQAGALCTACHTQRNWTGSTHATSIRQWNGNGINPWPTTPYATVADNACENCHRPHAAPRGPRLLGATQERDVCLVCHNGNVAVQDLEAEFAKPSAHPIDATDWTHEPREDPNTMPRHVACVDCHNPHQAVDAQASAPVASGQLRGVSGVNLSGDVVTDATNEYEVCLKCHGVADQTTSPAIVREDNIRNIGLKINPSNPGYHPVAAVGRNSSMGGFESGFSTGSLLYCTDCHNSDQGAPAGSGARGPHGSQFAPILEREYQTDDPTPESLQAYALCYTCHNRQFLITDQANTFPHAKHVVEQNTACAVCHDAHGARRYPHLINFMLRDQTGRTVVSPSPGGPSAPTYESSTAGQGTCFLLCHGKDHSPESYP